MREILHITTHMGGGVGKVLSGILTVFAAEGKDRHELLLLEEPEKRNFFDPLAEAGIAARVEKDAAKIREAMARADLVQLEWWHHPRMARFLSELLPMPVRLVLWAHVSGTFYPWLPPAFLRVPQRFVFTSAYSYENPFWDAATCAWTKEHAAMINSVGYFSSEALCHEKHDGFVIGYVGTLSYAKLHPEFCRFCARVKDIPGARFRLVGDAENEAQIRRDAEPFGIAEQLSFAGYVDDVTAELRRMDVFVYLLNLQHFGTTENVLLEAMKAGLAVVALDQCAEKHIVHHGETGLLVRTPEEYEQAVRYLYAHPEERARLGRNARRYIEENFSVERTAARLSAVYDEVMEADKSVCDFTGMGKNPHEVFLNFLPPDLRDAFSSGSLPQELPEILLGERKSSVRHFARLFPEDAMLCGWAHELALRTRGETP